MKCPYEVGDSITMDTLEPEKVWSVAETQVSGLDGGGFWVRFVPTKKFVPGWYRAVYMSFAREHIKFFEEHPGPPDYNLGRNTWSGLKFEDAWQRVNWVPADEE